MSLKKQINYEHHNMSRIRGRRILAKRKRLKKKRKRRITRKSRKR